MRQIHSTLGGVVKVVGSNLASWEIFTTSIGSFNLRLPSPPNFGPFGESGANFPVQLPSRSHFANIENKKLSPKIYVKNIKTRVLK